mgnify:CR=1 FL=1
MSLYRGGGASSTTASGASGGAQATAPSPNCRLYVRGSSDAGDALDFKPNPAKVSIVGRSTYVETGVAYDDMTGGGAPPIAWTRHQPTEIRVEGAFHASGAGTVQDALDRLEKFRRKTRTGEPPDLTFVFGRRSWPVRLVDVTANEKLWTTDGLLPQWVDYVLTLKVLRRG